MVGYFIHRIFYTPDILYTGYFIHRIFYTPDILYTRYFIHQIKGFIKMFYKKV
jgi:hypothetical protein